MKVWITRYALSKGIFSIAAKVDGEIAQETGERFAAFYHKPDWHEKLVDAIDHGEQMRAKKIRSLQNKINKLETMDITPSK